uniref:Uncharacterized protein n=1 Tax=Avena sativa TaxID=4498 RepID=A0ACD5YZR1_AVESA
MPDVCCPRYLPLIPKQAPCPCLSPEIYIALAVVAPVALVFWFLHRPLLEQLPDGVPDQIPATPEPEDLDSPTTPPQAETEGSGSTRASDEEDVGDGTSRAGIAPTFVNATIDRSVEIAGILDKILNAFGEILLDIHNTDESTIHPGNGLLIQSMEILFGTGTYIIEPYNVMFDFWISKLEEDAEWIGQGEKGQSYIFLLNNTYDVWQTMRCPRAPFSNLLELSGRLASMVQQYKKSYFHECWVPLNNPCHPDKFTSVFHTICKAQMTWKVTAELRYTLRQEIVDLILPPYELSLLALKANQSPLPKILYWLKRLMAGKKKQKKLTVEGLEKVIKDLFEG